MAKQFITFRTNAVFGCAAVIHTDSDYHKACETFLWWKINKTRSVRWWHTANRQRFEDLKATFNQPADEFTPQPDARLHYQCDSAHVTEISVTPQCDDFNIPIAHEAYRRDLSVEPFVEVVLMHMMYWAKSKSFVSTLSSSRLNCGSFYSSSLARIATPSHDHNAVDTGELPD